MSLWPKFNRHASVRSASGALPFNIRAPSYLVVTGHCRCWKCGGEAAIHALAVGPSFDYLDTRQQWRPGAGLAVLSYVESLAEQVVAFLGQSAPRYFRDESQWHRHPYWMNHCQHCGAKIGDYEAIEAPDAPFNVRKLERRGTAIFAVPEPFEAGAVLNSDRRRTVAVAKDVD